MSNHNILSTGASEPPTAEMWRSVGPQPEQFVAMASAVTKYLGLGDTDDQPHAVGNVNISSCLHI